MNRYIRAFAELLYPRTCAICGQRLNESERFLCTSCLTKLPYRDNGNMHDNDMLYRMPYVPSNLGHIAALLSYSHDSDVHRIIYDIKYRGRKSLAVYMGFLTGMYMQEAGFFQDTHMLIPVPLHPERMRTRGYNQATLIATGISQATGINVHDIMQRSADTNSQTTFGSEERTDNINRKFHINDTNICRGRNIVIVDDILTTGSTLAECASALEGLASTISLLTFAATARV